MIPSYTRAPSTSREQRTSAERVENPPLDGPAARVYVATSFTYMLVIWNGKTAVTLYNRRPSPVDGHPTRKNEKPVGNVSVFSVLRFKRRALNTRERAIFSRNGSRAKRNRKESPLVLRDPPVVIYLFVRLVFGKRYSYGGSFPAGRENKKRKISGAKKVVYTRELVRSYFFVFFFSLSFAENRFSNTTIYYGFKIIIIIR